MKRSMQEIVELVVFGLIALLVGTGVLWLLGWLIGLVGSLFMWLAGILWLLLRYIIPVVVIIAAVYALFRLIQRRNKNSKDKGLGDALRQGPVVSGSKDASSVDSSSSGGVIVTPSPSSSSADLSPSSVAGRPAGYSPADSPAAAPITTPAPVSTSGEPISPLSISPEVKPLADEPVMASGEPVPDVVAAPTPAQTDVIDASAEPVEVVVVEAEPVKPAESDNKADKGKKK